MHTVCKVFVSNSHRAFIMILTSLLPWVVMFHLQQDDGGGMVIRNITRFLNEDLQGVCSDDELWHIKKVELLDEQGNFIKRWFTKFYLNDDYDNNVNSGGFRKMFHREYVAVSSGGKRQHGLNLRICSENNRLLFNKLEITRFINRRPKRSSGITSNSLSQTWTSDVFRQTYTDENGLEIIVKVPRGSPVITDASHHHHYKSEDGAGESTSVKTIVQTMETTAATTSSTTTVHAILSPTCERYKVIVESVQLWTSTQLEKLRKGEMTDITCSASIPTN